MVETSNTRSILQPGLSVTGHLESKGDIVIGGRIDGEVTGRAVEVLEGASVLGRLEAYQATIRGTVEGHVFARAVTIGANATVIGELHYGTIKIARGARIELEFVPTFVVMGESPAVSRPRLVVEGPAVSPAQ
jgi:cytoskeletal protein CcmA (bactofilin family)